MAERDGQREDPTRKADGLSDLIRGAISSGVRTVLSSEEGVKHTLTEFIPKEASAYVRTQLEGLRKEVMSVVVKEFTRFLDDIDISTEVRQVISGMTIKINAEIRFDEKPAGGVRKKKAST